MTMWKAILAASALALMSSTTAMAARTDLVLGVVLEPPHLDPTAGAAAAIDEVVYANVFEGLTRIGPNGEVLPDLAESWTVSDDGKVYTFKLHTGVKFHDGTDFDANDVKFSLDRARVDNSVNAQKGLFSAIDTVEVIDPATVKVTLKHPQGSFLYNMGWGDAVMVAPESAGTNKEKPIGTGPFKFQNWAKGSAITLVKSDHYWGDPVFLDKAEFRIIPDAAAQVTALLSGDVQAISYALDRKAIIDGATGGLGVPIGSHMAPSNKAYVDLTGEYPYDPAKAKELLKEAGFAGGIKATLKLPPPDYARFGGEIVASELRDVGIDLEIIPVEWAQWLDQVFTKKDYDLTIVSHTEPNDIDIYSRKDYYFNYDNPAFDKVIAELNLTSDEAKRDELLKQAQKILADDAVVGFLFELPKVGVWDAKLQGMWTNAPIQANDLTKVKWSD